MRKKEGALNTFIERAPNTRNAKRAFPKGRSVTVYYDPTDHSKAQVVPMADDWWLVFGKLIVAAGMLMTFVGVLMVFGGSEDEEEEVSLKPKRASGGG